METFRVVEIFESVNGEGPRSGQLALFIRMQGCNLRCAYCDTSWANQTDAAYREMTSGEILDAVRASGIRNVTLTGGEPLLQPGIGRLIEGLTEEPGIRLEIETNGSMPLACFSERPDALSINMDYKLPGSGMEDRMRPENFAALLPRDTVKFVVADRADMDRARELIARYDLTKRCRVFFSPAYGALDPQEIVAYMKEYRMNDVTLQLQIHKVIWDADRRGV